MLLGKAIAKHGQVFLKDLTDDSALHLAPEGTVRGEYYAFEVNEDDDAVDLKPAAEFFIKDHGINCNTISFYVDAEGNEAESYFGTCDFTRVAGDIVPCTALTMDGEKITFEAGTWLVHSILGKLAGAF